MNAKTWLGALRAAARCDVRRCAAALRAVVSTVLPAALRAVLSAVLAAALFPLATLAQPPPAAAEPGTFAVAYVDVQPGAVAKARAAFARYRAAVTARGATRVDVLEQAGRPGHLAIVEQWRDPAALTARDTEARKQLLDALEPLRVSGYDERPYKVLAVAPAPAASAPAGRRGMYVVTHVDVAPNPQVAVLLQRLAEASRAEPGNLRFDVVQHTQRANHFTVIEQWRTQAALDAHAAAASTRRYRDELQPLTGSPLDERVYTAIE